MKQGVYSHRRPGQSLGVTEYGTSIVCAHPDCLTCFFGTNPHDEFCDEHRGLHPQGRRRLRLKPPPKLERHQFFPAGDNRVTYHCGPFGRGDDRAARGALRA
jgi:hypothetical protein